jgi:hypothetical protein
MFRTDAKQREQTAKSLAAAIKVYCAKFLAPVK